MEPAGESMICMLLKLNHVESPPHAYTLRATPQTGGVHATDLETTAATVAAACGGVIAYMQRRVGCGSSGDGRTHSHGRRQGR